MFKVLASSPVILIGSQMVLLNTCRRMVGRYLPEIGTEQLGHFSDLLFLLILLFTVVYVNKCWCVKYSLLYLLGSYSDKGKKIFLCLRKSRMLLEDI